MFRGDRKGQAATEGEGEHETECGRYGEAGQGEAKIARSPCRTDDRRGADERQQAGAKKYRDAADQEQAAADDGARLTKPEPGGETGGAERGQRMRRRGDAQRCGKACAGNDGQDLLECAQHHLQHEAGGDEVDEERQRARRPARREDAVTERQHHACRNTEHGRGQEEAQRCRKRRGVLVSQSGVGRTHGLPIRIATVPSS